MNTNPIDPIQQVDADMVKLQDEENYFFHQLAVAQLEPGASELIMRFYRLVSPHTRKSMRRMAADLNNKYMTTVRTVRLLLLEIKLTTVSSTGERFGPGVNMYRTAEEDAIIDRELRQMCRL